MSVKKQQCPVCGKARTEGHKPFCSKRCADIDLGRWLTESYALPAKADPEDEDLSNEDD